MTEKVLSMQIINAKWTPKINLLKIKCHCGNEFWHRADRWRVKCPECNYKDHLGPMRRRYWLRNQMIELIKLEGKEIFLNALKDFEEFFKGEK